MSVSRLISKGSIMGDTKYKVNINKNGFIMNLDAIKVNNESTLFYFKANRYPPKVSSPQEANFNLIGGKIISR